MIATTACASTTYTFTGSTYSLITNFTTCTTGPCANFTGAMSVSGSFTLAAALPANFSLQDITSRLVSYSFSDGLTTFTNSDPNVRINFFSVSTDGTGFISNANIELELWQTGSSPHVPGNRLAVLDLAGSTSTIVGAGTNNVGCLLLGTGSSGVADTCTSLVGDSSTSTAQANGGSWTGGGSSPPTSVPTLGEWGMIILTGLLSLFAWLRMRQATV
jgi:hypothetical protein